MRHIEAQKVVAHTPPPKNSKTAEKSSMIFSRFFIASAFLVQLSLAQLPQLPLAPISIPRNLTPPLAHGRVDVHGWLWLPVESPVQNDSFLVGYWYHHTPEFFHTSPHDFEIVTFGQLQLLSNAVHGLPVPPMAEYVGTEYVLSPPKFSLDDLVNGSLSQITGPFANGSFDTPQRYVIAPVATLSFRLAFVHYMSATAPANFAHLPYASFPRSLKPRRHSVHLYFVHILQQSPDFDQTIHGVVDLRSCRFFGADSAQDVFAEAANWVVPHSMNNVTHRLMPNVKSVEMALMTESTRTAPKRTTCQVTILEQVHCVVVPDSFANCP
jgi:hypothetical protein